MKKDKEWLKNEVKSLFDEAYDSGKMEYYESEESIHRINSLIDQLDEPEVLSLDWIDDNKKDSGVHSIGYYVPIGKLHDLLVPKQDKPVIPQFVADYYKDYEDLELTFEEWFGREEFEAGSKTENKTFEWLLDNSNEVNIERQFILADIIAHGLDGYEVEEEWINEHSKSYTMENSVEISDLKNLLLPQPKKPVIPKFVADWIDAHNLHGNNPLREYIDLESDFTEGWTNEEDAAVYHWINKDKNPYAFIDALRYGYEVEKEKRYHVVNKENYFMLRKYDGLVDILRVSSSMSRDEYGKDTIFMLTEKEIKDYDERYIPFMVPVDEVNND